MKKKTFIKIASLTLACAFLAFGAIAATESKNIEIFYRNIKLMIDGAEYVPTNVKGEIVEPFIYNGTTYLPVRAVANAFDKDVEWDGKTATVYLGKKDRMMPDNRLDKLQYVDYREDDKYCWFEKINGTVTDYNGNVYTNGMVGRIQSDDNYIEADYALNGQYSKFAGKIVLPKTIKTTTRNENDCDTGEMSFYIYDENDELLFKSTGINASDVFEFDISVKGVNMITIKVQGADGEDDKFFALTDLALYK